MQQRTRYTKNSVLAQDMHREAQHQGRNQERFGGVRSKRCTYKLQPQQLNVRSKPEHFKRTRHTCSGTGHTRPESAATARLTQLAPAQRYAANDSAHGRWVIPVTTHCLSGQCTAGQLSEGQSCQVCLRCRAGWQQQACSCGSPKQLRDVEAANGRLDAGGSRRRTQAHDGVPARQRGGQCARAARSQVRARCIDCHLHNGPPRVMRASTTAASCA